MTDWKVIEGDCVEVLAVAPDNSVDAIVTDPPYGLKFMGKDWDDMGRGNEQQAWHRRWTDEAYRVLKPGGHLLAFGGTRTYHRLASAVEDTGFEIRDQMQWLYGTGFPKSHNVSKAIDKAARGVPHGGSDPTSVNHGKFKTQSSEGRRSEGDSGQGYGAGPGQFMAEAGETDDRPLVPEAVQWEGWGTALKPAHEPIVVARKPLGDTVAATVLEYGTGALNINATRIRYESDDDKDQTRVPMPVQHNDSRGVYQYGHGEGRTGDVFGPSDDGRWPANVLLDEEAGATLDEQSDAASRFFYQAKASKAEREAGLTPAEGKPRANTHPTVKPIALMVYLVLLVTPPGGIVLDPFVGSGTTGIAAVQGGFRFIGIELDADYADLARQRIAHWAQEATTW